MASDLIEDPSLGPGLAASGSDLFFTTSYNTIAEYTTSGGTVNAALVSGLNNPKRRLRSSNRTIHLCPVRAGALGLLAFAARRRLAAAQAKGRNMHCFICATFQSGYGPVWAVALSSAAGRGQDMYVAANGNGPNSTTIGEYTTSGSTVNASLISGLNSVGSIALSGSDLFVVNENADTISEYTTSGALVNPSLITGVNGDIAVSGSKLFIENPNRNSLNGAIGEYTTSGAIVNTSLISGLNTPLAIAVSGSNLFVTSVDAGTIGEYTTSGDTVNPSLISGLSNPWGLVLSGSDMFVTSVDTGIIGEYTTSGGTVDSSLVSGLNGPIGIAVSGSDLFVANSNIGTVGQYTTSGGAVNASLISGLGGPVWIAIETPEPSTFPLLCRRSPLSATVGDDGEAFTSHITLQTTRRRSSPYLRRGPIGAV